MDFEYSDKVKALQEQLSAFMEAHIYPNEKTFFAQIDQGDRWQPVPIVEELKQKARAAGLWNLFLPESDRGAGLTNLEYAPCAPSIMGRVGDRLRRSSTAQRPTPATWRCCTAMARKRYQKETWLRAAHGRPDPLRPSLMTEPAVASSDATNIETSIRARRQRLRHQRPQVVVVRRR